MQNQKMIVEKNFFDICIRKNNKALFNHLLDITDPDQYQNNEKLWILKCLCYSRNIQTLETFKNAIDKLKPNLNKPQNGDVLLTFLHGRYICDYKYNTYEKDRYKLYSPLISYLLTRKDVDVNAYNRSGRTTLQDLLLNNFDNLYVTPEDLYKNLEKQLLDAGAQYNLINKKGQTLLHLAVLMDQPLRVIQFVVKMKGIVLDKLDKSKKTALDIAQENYERAKERYDNWKANPNSHWYKLDDKDVEDKLKIVDLLKALTLEGL